MSKTNSQTTTRAALEGIFATLEALARAAAHAAKQHGAGSVAMAHHERAAAALETLRDTLGLRPPPPPPRDVQAEDPQGLHQPTREPRVLLYVATRDGDGTGRYGHLRAGQPFPIQDKHVLRNIGGRSRDKPANG